MNALVYVNIDRGIHEIKELKLHEMKKNEKTYKIWSISL